MIWVHRDFDSGRLEVWMSNSIGGRSPLRNEHGQIVDFDFELRMLGGTSQIGRLTDRLQVADTVFREWGEE